eukprot:4606564-Ditylum_brightwellii.AAC.1
MFIMNLPPSFTIKDSKEREASYKSGNEDTDGRKRKKKKRAGNKKEKSRTETNAHQVKEFQLKKGNHGRRPSAGSW